MSTERSPSPDPPPFPLPTTLHPFVQELKDALVSQGRWNSLGEAVEQAKEADIKQMADWGITSAETFLEYASGLMTWTPSENVGGKEIYSVLCLFYFVFDRPAISDLQTPIEISSIGTITKLSHWVVCFAVKMGAFMDTTESLTPESYQTFVNSPYFNLDEAELPDPDGPTGGFTNFNQLFARRLKAGMRPVSCPKDDRVIVHPADSTFDGQWTIQPDGTVPIDTYQIQTQTIIKNIPWPISELVGGSDYAKYYDNGIWMHSFLSPADYHRQHAPVSGKVVEAKLIPGLCYLNVVTDHDSKGNTILKPHRRWGKRRTEDGNSFDAPDDAGYQFLQARACITIYNDTLHHVTVLPIGMAQVSSVVLSVKPGDIVEKGVTELSHFEFGGSDCVVIFEPTANVTVFGAVDPKTGHGQKYLVGEVLGYANPLSREHEAS